MAVGNDDHLYRSGDVDVSPVDQRVVYRFASKDGSVCRKRRNPGDVAKPAIVPGSSFAESMARSEHVKRTGRSTAATIGG